MPLRTERVVYLPVGGASRVITVREDSLPELANEVRAALRDDSGRSTSPPFVMVLDQNRVMQIEECVDCTLSVAGRPLLRLHLQSPRGTDSEDVTLCEDCAKDLVEELEEHIEANADRLLGEEL